MNSGKSISVEKAIVTNISPFRIWLIASDGNEYFVSYKDYPIFENSDIKDIADVQTDFEGNLHWSALDADIELESLKHPEKFPLSYS